MSAGEKLNFINLDLYVRQISILPSPPNNNNQNKKGGDEKVAHKDGKFEKQCGYYYEGRGSGVIRSLDEGGGDNNIIKEAIWHNLN